LALNKVQKLHLGRDQISLLEYVEMACEDVVKSKYATKGLMNLALGIDYNV
jgi:hypothetical protein